MEIGKRIKKLRIENKLSQKELAAKLYVTDKAISSWEQDRTEPDIAMIIKLCEIFQCNTSYLINGETLRNDIETEIKIALTEKEFRNLAILLKDKAQYQGEMLQSDTYFATRKNKQEYLRIGRRGNKNILTYKAKREKNCEELEVELDDGETLGKIFTALNFEQIGVVEKVRQTYLYLNKYEIVLDQVKNVGYFIEIEIKKYDMDQNNEYLKLLQTAKDLGLNINNIATKHYLDYVLEKQG